MTFRTITAKYPGTCKRCHSAIYVGDRIRYAGPGRTWHLAADCQAASATIAPTSAPALDADDIAAVEAADGASAGEYTTMTIGYGSTPVARVRGPRRSSYALFSSGAEVFTNARGRCEDAPCCGCCS